MNKWQPLQRATGLTIKPELAAKMEADPEVRRLVLEGENWVNDIYQVNKRRIDDKSGPVEVYHLSIKRTDRKPCREWRDFQRIKNQLCGEEAEGIELYPAESRVVDSANQYHLWVFVGYRIPVGFKSGLRAGPEEAAEWGATQAPEEP